jgi:hypothetical protein
MDTRKKIIIAVVVIAALVGAYFLFATPKTDEEAAKTAPGAAPQPGVATGPAASASMNNSPNPGVSVAAINYLEIASRPNIAYVTVDGNKIFVITKKDTGEIPVGVDGWNQHVAYVIGNQTILPGSANFVSISQAVSKAFSTWKTAKRPGAVASF